MDGLVLCISCMADMTAEKQSTLTTKQQCDPENSRREEMPKEKASADKSLYSEWKFRKKRRKKPVDNWKGQLKLRVRSWLRMNAGGVLNTCKSNGDALRRSACIPEGCILVADG